MNSFNLISAILGLFIIQFQPNVLVTEQDDECKDVALENLPSYLNPSTVPDKYWLFLKVDLDRRHYNGHVSINISLKPEVDVLPFELQRYLYLNLDADIEIKKSETKLLRGETELEIGTQCRNSTLRFWVIEVLSLMTHGWHVLELEFSGNIGDSYDGIYRHDYFENGIRVSVAGSTNPRFFPCFDHLGFKATYDITIQHRPHLFALASVPKVNETLKDEVDGQWTISYFKSSLFLPIHAISFNLNEFTRRSKTVTNVVTHVIMTRQEVSDAPDYALEAVPVIMEFYIRYFATPSEPPKPSKPPFNKVFTLALPEFTFPAQLQGLFINFKEKNLLWRTEESTVDDLFGVVSTIAHELSHYWFGTRVTSAHIRYKWLEEGFADWIKFKGVVWKRNWQDYYMDEQITNTWYGYDVDSRRDGHPIIVSEEEYRERNRNNVKFVENIIYSKGASVVRMMEGHIGAARFQIGLQHYIQDFNWLSVTPEQLFAKLQAEVADEFDVTAVYSNWLFEPGFPVITVTRDGNQIKLRQDRFLFEEQAAGDTIWQIPIRYYLNGDRHFDLFREKEITLPHNVSADSWIKLNIDHQGFFITAYDDWNQLNLHVAAFSSLETAGLLLDIIFLTRSEKVEYEKVSSLVGQVLNNSRSVVTWRMGQNITSHVYQYLRTDPAYREQFSQLVRTWILNKYEDGMWDEVNKSPDEIRFGVAIIQMACLYGHQPCLDEAKRRFDSWKDFNFKEGKVRDPIIWPAPNTRAKLFAFGLKASRDVEDFKLIWNLFKETENNAFSLMKTELGNALSYVSDPNLIQKFLVMLKDILNNSEDLLVFMDRIAQNPDAFNNAWKFLKENVLNVQTVAAARLQNVSVFNPSLELKEQLLLIFANQFTEEGIENEIAALLESWPFDKKEKCMAKVEAAIDKNRQWQKKCVDAFFSPIPPPLEPPQNL